MWGSEFLGIFVTSEGREGQQVLSQGISLRKFGNVVFRNEQKLPGISLCIGNYQKKEVQVGDISVEFYYFSDHEEFFEDLPFLVKRCWLKSCRSTNRSEWNRVSGEITHFIS
ncbi:MAG: hypothetical protein V8R91_05720 [Butyricimonas faecihominis]